MHTRLGQFELFLAMSAQFLAFFVERNAALKGSFAILKTADNLFKLAKCLFKTQAADCAVFISGAFLPGPDVCLPATGTS